MPGHRLEIHPPRPGAAGLAAVRGTRRRGGGHRHPVDTNKIVAAVQFVPCSLSVTRSLDLSGEGGSQPSSAQFSGAVLLPQELQPKKWGDPKLDEVTDAKGNDLKPADNDENRFSSRSFSSRFEGDDEDDTNQPSHLVTMEFRAPDWKIKEIARIKGSIDLQYFGGSQVVKPTNAVPAAWIVDASKGAGSMMGMDRRRKICKAKPSPPWAWICLCKWA